MAEFIQWPQSEERIMTHYMTDFLKVQEKDGLHWIEWWPEYDWKENKSITFRVDPEHVDIIGKLALWHALEVFDYCGCIRDFCIQEVFEPHRAIFGSVNRLVWNVSSGWWIDTGLCNPEFISNYAKFVAEEHVIYPNEQKGE